MLSEQCQSRFAFLGLPLSSGSAPANILSHTALTGQPFSKVNYGHSLHGGISLAVIAPSIPLPCALRFFFFCPRFTSHWCMNEQHTVPQTGNECTERAKMMRLEITLCTSMCSLLAHASQRRKSGSKAGFQIGCGKMAHVDGLCSFM